MTLEEYKQLINDIMDPEKADKAADNAKAVLDGIQEDDKSKTEIQTRLDERDKTIKELNNRLFTTVTGQVKQETKPEKTPEEIFREGWDKLYPHTEEDKKS